VLDFWRVEKVEENKLLRLRAEMRSPGAPGWSSGAGAARRQNSLSQRAFFVPKGLPGLAYWYVLYPIHTLIFSGTDPRDCSQGGRRRGRPTAQQR